MDIHINPAQSMVGHEAPFREYPNYNFVSPAHGTCDQEDSFEAGIRTYGTTKGWKGKHQRVRKPDASDDLP